MRRLMLAASLFAAFAAGSAAADDDTPAAAATRKLLKTKITADYKETKLSEIVEDIQDQIKEKTKKKLTVLIDSKGGVSRNSKFTYKANDKPLEEVLDEMFKKNDMGYVVLQKGAYPGALQIVKGKARGNPEKKD